MARSNANDTQARIDRKTWWLIGLSILVILGFSITVPLLLLSLVRAKVLDGVMPPDGGFSLVAGLVGMALLFSLNLVYQHAHLNKVRQRSVQDQMDLEQAKSRLAELASLFQIGNSLRLDLPLQTILEITVRRLASALRAHEADLYLLSRETKSLHCRASYGLSSRAPEAEVPYGEGPVGACARSREGLLLRAGVRHARFPDFFADRPDTGSALILPLQAEGRCLGVVRISRGSKAEPFREEHRELAQLFADNLAAVVSRVSAAAALRTSAAASAAAPVPASESAAAGSFQDVLVAAAGQELKSPLTAVVAYAEVMDQNDRSLTPAMRAEFAVRLRDEAQRMMTLVDDVLDVVRLELGRYLLDLRVGDVNELVASAVDSVRPAAAARPVTIDLTLDAAVPQQHLDAAKLRQSIAHLVRNAVRFSPPQGRIAVSTSLTDGEVLVRVRDDGPPVDADPAGSLFEIEAMVGEGERAKQGRGFGLHLTKRFVQLHGGTVGADSAPDGGAVFWIRLPAGNDLTSFVGQDPFVGELAGR